MTADTTETETKSELGSKDLGDGENEGVKASKHDFVPGEKESKDLINVKELTGVLLINLGTPDSFSPSDVARYLKQFLTDPFVIDIPALPRYALVYGIIAPFRAKKSAAMYKKIWLGNGQSPLLYYSKLLTDKVASSLGEEFDVKLAMRYGSPSVASQLIAFREAGVKKILVQPLFPQYALATFKSAAEKVDVEAKRLGMRDAVVHLPPYFADGGFIEAETSKLAGKMKELSPDHVVFTFHGLPVRHCKKTEKLRPGEASRCGTDGCCDVFETRNEDCYRAQCVQTAKAIAKGLSLGEADYTVAFQSRFGKDPWIEPYTDKTLEELKKAGKKKVMVVSPSFAVDCLETLEEVGIGLKEDFEQDYDGTLIVEPCLNDDEKFAKFLAGKVKVRANAEAAQS